VDKGKLHPSAMLLLAATLEDTELGLQAVQATIDDRRAERLMMHLEPRLTPLRKSPRIAALFGAREPRVIAAGQPHPLLPGL
jgi:hypothetical protein